jgi:cyanate permease
MTFAIALQWFLLARGDRAEDQSEVSRFTDVFGNLIKIPNVRLLLMMGLIAFAIGHGFASWLPKILENSGMSASHAGWAAAIYTAAGIPSILMLPSLVPPRLRGRFIAIFAVLTAGSLVLVMKISGGALYFGLAALGFISAPFMALLLLILMDSPGVETRYMGSAGGMFFCVAEIGGFTGPLIMGILVDITGTFMAGALFIAGLCFAMAVLILFLDLN